MHELRIKNVSSRLVPQSVVNDYCVLWTVNTKKTYNKELGQISYPFPSINKILAPCEDSVSDH